MIEFRELYVDQLLSEEQLWQAWDAASLARNQARAPFRTVANFDDRCPMAAPAWAVAAASTNAATAIHFVLRAVACATNVRKAVDEEAELCGLLRDLFNNPACPVTLAPACLSSTVVALAMVAYKERELPSGYLDPDRLAVLADALEEAGCDNNNILDHLRGPGPHVRGCWLLDMLLNK